MNPAQMALAARAYERGRAVRAARLRHRYLAAQPLALVLWQLGAEPFSVAALGWGNQPSDLTFRVTGEPRSRDLLFSTLLGFAHWFNPRFEGAFTLGSAPQLIVANGATVGLLGRLGRRLAYLTGADPALVRLGQHLLFLHREARVPGQQLIVPLTEVLQAHWATPQSAFEQESLAALDAFIAPPDGLDGFAAAELAEQHPVGPLPTGEDDARLEPRLAGFNAQRAGATARAIVEPLLGPIEKHYRPLVERTWSLLWRCHARELAYPEAPSVARRWEADEEAYEAHMEWVTKGPGHVRTRQSSRQAARTLHRLEEAQKRLKAEEACDDPVKMIPYLLDGSAVQGRVIQVDTTHREVARVKAVRRPRLTLQTSVPCTLTPGKALWWTGHPSGPSWELESAQPLPQGGMTLMLKLGTSRLDHLPPVGADACFSTLNTCSSPPLMLPPSEPWTHREPPAPGPLDEAEEEALPHAP